MAPKLGQANINAWREDALYPTSEGPDAVKKYSGTTKYMMHLERGSTAGARILVAHHVQRRVFLRRHLAHSAGQRSGVDRVISHTHRFPKTSGGQLLVRV
jgi:hypothetical protein